MTLKGGFILAVLDKVEMRSNRVQRLVSYLAATLHITLVTDQFVDGCCTL